MVEIPVSQLVSFPNRNALRSRLPDNSYIRILSDNSYVLAPNQEARNDEFVVTVNHRPLLSCYRRPLRVSYNDETQEIQVHSEVP